jgi:mannose-6-phosphate isomerase-like protein (cupin superfamily)
MLKMVRRAVTGIGISGRSAVVIDDIAENRTENEVVPGLGVTIVWKCESVPSDNGKTKDSAGSDFRLCDAPAGVDFIVCEFPPFSEQQKIPSSERASAWLGNNMLPSNTRTDASLHAGMHQHDSTDYITMISGEITLILEEGEVTLRAGDTIVQRGTMHAWENRGSVPAVLSSAVISAKPVR